MTVERALRLIAGALVALSVLLGIFVSAKFLWFTLFVGVNLFQSGFTNWCPMKVILRKGGLPDAMAPGTPVNRMPATVGPANIARYTKGAIERWARWRP